jgi:hypothetical protein
MYKFFISLIYIICLSHRTCFRLKKNLCKKEKFNKQTENLSLYLTQFNVHYINCSNDMVIKITRFILLEN